MASEIKVDTISEKTSANGVTIDGVSLKDSKIATANSVDSDAYVDGSIDTAHIDALQVTGAKLNTDVISAQTELAAEPADTDEFMVSDAGVLKRIDYSLIKGGDNTPAFSAYKPSTQADVVSGTQTKVTFTTEFFDTDSAYASSRFTCPVGSAGKYLITGGLSFLGTGDGNYVIIFIYLNGSELWKNINRSPSTSDNGVGITGLVELAEGDYVEIYCKQNTGSNQDITGSSTDRTTYFGGFKLI